MGDILFFSRTMQDEERKRLPLRWILAGIVFVGIIVVSVGFFFWEDLRALDIDLESMISTIQEKGALIFFTALALLPLVGMPVSIFYLVAGASFGMPMSLGGTALALAVNISLSYWLARGLLRKMLEMLLSRTHYRIPQVKGNDYFMLTLFVRIMPGVPFFLQNYLLGVARVPFRIYFMVSWTIAFVMSAGIIVLGNSFQSSSIGQIVFAVMLVVALLIMVRLVRQRLKEKEVLVDSEREESAKEGRA
jgi:uncharacterized membrane protein YdjX (TVP38/TMEM64 family)